jgi:hypothetical protein
MPSKKQTYVKQIHTDTDSGLFLADYATISMSASIFSLKGLLENQKLAELNTTLQKRLKRFLINKRQASSIITFIDGEIKSAQESQARRAINYSEGVPARTAYEGREPKKHVWSYWNVISKRVKGSARHSFFQPRPTASSSLRNGTTENSFLEFGSSVANGCNNSGGLNYPNEQTFASPQRTVRMPS